MPISSSVSRIRAAFLLQYLVHGEERSYPESDLVFYEGFDNFVWGGNWMGGEQAFGFAPDANTVNPVTTLVRDGYADATVKVAYNTPGSSFIQSDVWTTVENSTVGESHLMGKSYITSRNIADWNYLYRCQEYQGALGVGMGTAYRGILELPALRVPAYRAELPEGDALYRPAGPERLTETVLTLIPYFAWNNRGKGEMRVWLPVKG